MFALAFALQMDRDKFMGRLAIGRIASGCVRVGDTLCTLKRDGSGSEPAETARVTKILARRGLQIGSMEEAVAGDIVQVLAAKVLRLVSTMQRCEILIAHAAAPPHRLLALQKLAQPTPWWHLRFKRQCLLTQLTLQPSGVWGHSLTASPSKCHNSRVS